MRFFLRWVLPQLFYITSYFVFLDGKESNWKLIGLFFVIITLNDIGDFIVRGARKYKKQLKTSA